MTYLLCMTSFISSYLVKADQINVLRASLIDFLRNISSNRAYFGLRRSRHRGLVGQYWSSGSTGVWSWSRRSDPS